MSWETITEAKNKLNELIKAQGKVDAGIAKMPAGKDKDRLIKVRDANRGFFSNYVMPAWKKVQSLIGDENANFAGEFKGSNTLGVLPLIPIAAVMSATALLGYVAKSFYTESSILNDPAFTAAQKADLLKSTSTTGGLTAVADVSSNLAKMAFLGAGLFILVKYGTQLKSGAQYAYSAIKGRG